MYILRSVNCSSASETDATSTWRNPSSTAAAFSEEDACWGVPASGCPASARTPANARARLSKVFRRVLANASEKSPFIDPPDSNRRGLYHYAGAGRNGLQSI